MARTPRRGAVIVVMLGLAAVFPLAVNELVWSRQWLVPHPDRQWVYGAALSAFAATAFLARHVVRRGQAGPQ